MLENAAALNLEDHFEFAIGKGVPIRAEGPEGGLRFPVESRLAGRLFETLRLDVNSLPGDQRPVEDVELRNLFDFADFPVVVVPAISAAQQLAEKLHAYTRDYGSHDNSRAKDLYDMLLIAEELPIPSLRELAAVCAETFALRDTSWPPSPAPPPVDWQRPWAAFVRDYGSRFASLGDAFSALAAFWDPVLQRNPGSRSRWDRDLWVWRPTSAES
jgi:hypothetical protein